MPIQFTLKRIASGIQLRPELPVLDDEKVVKCTLEKHIREKANHNFSMLDPSSVWFQPTTDGTW